MLTNISFIHVYADLTSSGCSLIMAGLLCFLELEVIVSVS